MSCHKYTIVLIIWSLMQIFCTISPIPLWIKFCYKFLYLDCDLEWHQNLMFFFASEISHRKNFQEFFKYIVIECIISLAYTVHILYSRYMPTECPKMYGCSILSIFLQYLRLLNLNFSAHFRHLTKQISEL